MRSIRILLAIVAGAFVGCSLEEALEGAPCNTADDCLGDQQCIPGANNTNVCASGSGGGCEPGTAGCVVNGSGGCTDFSLVTPGPDGGEYCCDGSNPIVLEVSAEGFPTCITCDASMCTFEQEQCVTGDARCELYDDSCGCRLKESEIVDSPCTDADTCGEGFACTRTLEQLAEPDESSASTQAEQDGFCRPETDPACSIGQQDGCRKDGSSSCGSGLSEVCNGPTCYCCAPPDGSGYTTKIYDVSPDEREVACTWCSTSACTESGSQACTTLSDSSCVLNAGLCGCTPAT